MKTYDPFEKELPSYSQGTSVNFYFISKKILIKNNPKYWNFSTKEKTRGTIFSTPESKIIQMLEEVETLVRDEEVKAA